MMLQIIAIAEMNLLPAHVREEKIQNAVKPPHILTRTSNNVISPYKVLVKKFKSPNRRK